MVTPYVGVWIETIKEENQFVEPVVTPYVGVWIETPTCDCFQNHSQVTPYVGVWIETSIIIFFKVRKSHTLRGCVD